MIRINLAKSSAFAGDDEGAGAGLSLPSFGGFAGGAGENPLAKVVAVVLLPLALFIYEQRGLSSYRVTLAEKTKQKEQVQRDISQFGSAASAVEDIKIERDRLQKRLAVIAKISSKRAFKIDTLAELQKLIPNDCWIDEVRFQNTQIEFKGFARLPSSVQNFVERLTQLNYLGSVANQGLKRTQLGETSVHELSLIHI